jgi:hypothetical protein
VIVGWSAGLIFKLCLMFLAIGFCLGLVFGLGVLNGGRKP